MINHNIVNARAVIAWIAAPGRPAPPAFAEALRAAHYRLAGKGDRAPDVAVVDLCGADPASPAAADAVAAARRLGAHAGVLIAAGTNANAEDRRRLARLGETVFTRTSVEPLIGALRERLRVAALADETGDRLKTLVADGRPVALAPAPPRREDFSVLIAGKPSPIALTVSNAAAGMAKSAASVFSAGQAMRALDHGAFHGAVFIPADENDLLIALARALRRHREHRRLPVIIVSEDDDLLDRRAAKDGLETMSAARVGEDLSPRLETVTRRALMAANMRAFLRSGEGNGGAIAASPRLFAQHAVRCLHRADETGRTISFVALTLAPKAEGVSTAASRLALDEALRTAARLVRAEDMIARLTATTLVVMLRGTTAADAERVAHRLEGVIAGTQSRASLDHADVFAAAIERHPGVEIERVIAALVADLRGRRRAKSA